MPKIREIAADTMGGRLRAARTAKNLTLEKVGKQLGVSAQAVSQWEHGETQPAVDKLCLLVKLLEVHLADVLDMPSGSYPRHTALKAISDRLEQVLEYLPTAQPAIIDSSVNRCVAGGVYLVRLRTGERIPVLGRVVWPKI
jgi:transcriptional regulator with XRE-family HTH domain